MEAQLVFLVPPVVRHGFADSAEAVWEEDASHPPPRDAALHAARTEHTHR